MPPHIAILLLDTPIPNFSAINGTFDKVTDDLLTKNGNTTLTKTYNIIENQDFPSLESIENGDVTGLVLTGSRSDAYKDEEWILNLIKFLQSVWDIKNLPMIGICFGHQIIARSLGFNVIKNEKGWEYGVIRIDVNETSQKLFGEKLFINSYHRDVVLGSHPDVDVIGSTSFCEIQGLVSRKFNLLTFQGHPEFTEEYIAKLFYDDKVTKGDMTENEYKIRMNQMGTNKHQGDAIGKVIVDFLN